MTITKFMIFKGLLIVVAIALPVVYALAKKRGIKSIHQGILVLLAAFAVLDIVILLFLFYNHVSFPLNLEGIELIRLQHVRRALQGLPIFVDPTPEYIPLVYQPLYYYLSIPLIWVFGDTLSTLRLVSILGSIGAGVVIFLAVREHTRSTWWAVIAAGLFAAAYRAMDSYLDIASSDSWLIFTILLGCYLVARPRVWFLQLLGILLLTLSFWLKQHGAIFVLGALIFITWKNDWRKMLPMWVIAILLGPVAYYLSGPSLFGPRFLFFTQEVPRQWMEFSWNLTVARVLLISANYLLLIIAGIAGLILQLKRNMRQIDIWYFMLPFAMLSGFLAAFVDPEGNNNVFIPMGVWFIITGVNGIKDLTESIQRVEQWGLHVFAIFFSFVILLFNPKAEMISSQVDAQYRDLVNTLQSLDGTVYAPYTGPLEEGYEFHPIANWVTMIDLVRGPGATTEDSVKVNSLLEAVRNPQGNAYILTDRPLETDPLIGYLAESYSLELDFGTRFYALKGLPMRFIAPPPQYLYRFRSVE